MIPSLWPLRSSQARGEQRNVGFNHLHPGHDNPSGPGNGEHCAKQSAGTPPAADVCGGNEGERLDDGHGGCARDLGVVGFVVCVRG